jgi:hypothetical protein
MPTPHTAPGRSVRSRPALEPLEDRCCPSTLSLQGHTLVLTGDNAAEVFTIRDAGNGNVTASIAGAGRTKTLSAHGVQAIVVHSGNGNDRVDYALTNKMTTSRSIEVDLGSGTDQVKLDFSKGVAAPALNVRLNGGAGNDTANVLFGAIANTVLNARENLGAGNDHFSASFNGPISGAARVLLQTQNGSGFDGVNVGIRAAIAATAQVEVDAFGGPRLGTTHVNYQGQLNGRLTIKEQAGPSGDLLGSDVTLTAGSHGVFRDKLQGGRGADLLVLRLKNQSSKMKSVAAAIDGGGGADAFLTQGKVQVTHV